MSWSKNGIKNLWQWALVTKDCVLDSYWIQKLAAYDRIYIGFSGGMDSTVLLHFLAAEPALMNKIHAVHINHGISAAADAWQTHCEQLCERLTIPCKTYTVSFNRQANVEEEARNARYQVFSQLVEENHCLLTAHHRDDQAETVLLHLFRGAGLKGLSGISETAEFGRGHLHRPLLTTARDTLHAYALAHQLAWITDESNSDIRFSRNFLRQQVVPLLQKKWPGVSKNLVRTAQLCRESQANLDDLALMDCPSLKTRSNKLVLNEWIHLKKSRLLNVLRRWLQINCVKMPNYDTQERLITELICAKRDANPAVGWDNWVIKRFQNCLYLEPARQQDSFNALLWTNFPQSLLISDIGVLSARPASQGIKILPEDEVEVRFRQGCETLVWHGQTKSLKKLMQQWNIPPWLRPSVPLIYVNQQLAAVVGYAISDVFYANTASFNYEISCALDG